MKLPVARLLGIIAIFMVAMIPSAACSSSGNGGGGPTDGITVTQTIAQFRDEEKALTLAPGWQWPSRPTIAAVGPDGKAIMYQNGYGKTAADHYWYCTWEYRYLEPSLTQVEKQKAYDALKTVVGTHYYKVALLPADQNTLMKGLNDAGLGDTGEMQKDVNLNCQKNTNE